MDYQIILVYCLCADLLKALQHKEDRQCQMSDAEVMREPSGCGLVAALYFGGKHTLACPFLEEQGYIPKMVSKSQFSRRLGCPLGAIGLPVYHLVSGVGRELQRTE